MKKLRDYAVRVNNPTEYCQAIKFFKLASKRPVYPSNSPYHTYVGMGTTYGMSGYSKPDGAPRYVMSGPRPYNTETVISINEIKVLADTPSRKRAYKTVFGNLPN